MNGDSSSADVAFLSVSGSWVVGVVVLVATVKRGRLLASAEEARQMRTTRKTDTAGTGVIFKVYVKGATCDPNCLLFEGRRENGKKLQLRK